MPSGDDGLSGRFAGLVLWPVPLLIVLWLLLLDFDVLIARDCRTAFGWLAVGSGDLYQLRLGRNPHVY